MKFFKVRMIANLCQICYNYKSNLRGRSFFFNLKEEEYGKIKETVYLGR